MCTNIKPEISKKKKYYISKNRYYELLYFCRQYYDYKATKQYTEEVIIPGINVDKLPAGSDISDITCDYALKLEKLDRKIEMIEKTCYEADAYLVHYIFEAVTKGIPFSVLEAKGIPCSKNTFYDRYRRFFWLLDKVKE